MFVYKENVDLMRTNLTTEQQGRKGGNIIGSSNEKRTKANNNISLGLEGGIETRLVEKGDNNPKTSTGDSSGDSFKKQFPSFDVKIIGGKKLIIYHDDDLITSTSAKM